MSGTSIERSPYEAALGDVLDGLHPRLRTYFAAIPAGHLGVGEGVFTRVGTPRRWLWPVLWLFAREGVLFPVWERDVPFTVVNRPTVDDGGRIAVAAVRTFRLGSGTRRMVDAITADPAGLVDFLGVHRCFDAELTARVVDGAMHLASAAVALRVAGHRIRIPAVLAPRVALVERFEDTTDSQHVEVTVDLPLLGRLYEYGGSFCYSILPITPGEAPE